MAPKFDEEVAQLILLAAEDLEAAADRKERSKTAPGA